MFSHPALGNRALLPGPPLVMYLVFIISASFSSGLSTSLLLKRLDPDAGQTLELRANVSIWWYEPRVSRSTLNIPLEDY